MFKKKKTFIPKKRLIEYRPVAKMLAKPQTVTIITVPKPYVEDFEHKGSTENIASPREEKV